MEVQSNKRLKARDSTSLSLLAGSVGARRHVVRHLIFLLTFLSPLTIYAAEIPENAHVNLYGNGWECIRGYRKSGGKCEEVVLPQYAKINVYGNGWQCKRVYAPSSNQCIKFSVPENASISPGGNSWNCNLNFKRSGSVCVPMSPQEIAYQNMLIMQARACGRSYNYDVSGYCDGEYVYGNVDACSKSKDVSGYITYDNGAEQNFDGE